MAANLVTLRAALVHVGTTAEVANEITATQGIDTIEELRMLTDDEVETLCRTIRRPGGLMPNPVFNAVGGTAAALAAGIPAQIMIQFPPEMDENWVRYGLAKLGQISKLPNWQKIVVLCVHNTTSALNS